MTDMVSRCSPLFGLGSELQAFRGPPPRDHAPLYLELQGMQPLEQDGATAEKSCAGTWTTR
eukprot:4996019-Pyramimonas_sp.AAC.1